MLLAADDMGYTHQLIIDDARKAVRRESITFLYDKIAYFTGCKPDLAANNIVNHKRLVSADGKTYRYRPALSPHLLSDAVSGEFLGTGINEAFLLCLGLLAHSAKLVWSIETIIGLFLIEKLSYIFIVNLPPLGLQIRTIRAANLRPLIPFDAQPAKVLHYLPNGGRRIAFLVRILDTQNKFSAHPPGQEPVKKGGSGTANMQVTCR